MEKTDLLSRISTLSPDKLPIAQALSFIRVVVNNNPNTSLANLKKRPDLKSAIKVITDWVDDVESIMKDSFEILPKAAARQFVDSINQTLQGIREEVKLSQPRLADWRVNNDNAPTWAAKIILRMTWTLDWMEAQINGLTMDAPFKRWVCRMSPTSCSYCRALNGVTIPRAASFAKYARKAGYKNIYGGLYGPKLHPRCQCYVIPITRAEYDTYKNGGSQ